MKRFAVFTTIAHIDGTYEDVMVFNVEAQTNGGAEHKLLDNYDTINNALAFDMETEMVQAAPYIANTKCYDIKDFDKRCREREARIQEYIDREIDEINDAKAENVKHTMEIAQLKERIRQLEGLIVNNNNYIEYSWEELEKACYNVGMRAEHSKEEEVQGIA